MKKNNNIIQNNNGFSLIEMLIAITIFAVGLLAMAQLQTHSIVYNAQAQSNTLATIEAQSRMDQVMSAGYAAATSSQGSQQIAGTPYSTTTTVLEKLEDLKRYKEVDVVITWTYRGQPKNYALSSIIAKLDN